MLQTTVGAKIHNTYENWEKTSFITIVPFFKKRKKKIFFWPEFSVLDFTKTHHALLRKGSTSAKCPKEHEYQRWGQQGGNDVKSLQSLGRASVIAIEKYTKVYANLYKCKLGLTFSFNTLFTSGSKTEDFFI